MTKTTAFDVADYLDNDASVAAYLALVFQEGDAAEIRSALNDVARARGMSELARQTGLTREALYKALGEDGNPTLSTLLAVIKALGIKLSIAA